MDNRYFNDSYQQGRSAFLELCDHYQLKFDSVIHPKLKGPAGEDLAMDWLWLGDDDAQKVLLVSSGTHGLEASVGSASICHWLTSEPWRDLPDGMAVLIVHTINPYGWAWSRRGNEEGIDLNRNCLDHQAGHLGNEAYELLHSLVAGARGDEAGLTAFAKDFSQFSDQHGLNYAVEGVTVGQYHYPDGLSYGGVALSWSCQTLLNIAKRCLGNAKKIVHIDWHTGIGNYGEAHFLLDENKSSQSYALASGFWPDHIIHSDDVVDGISIDYRGLVTAGLRDYMADLNGAEMVSLVVEWGTYEINVMLGSLLMDNWLTHRATDADDNELAIIEEKLRRLFCPADEQWRNKVLTQSLPIHQQAIAGLHSW